MSDWQRSQLQCRHEGRQNWLHAKKRTLSERQGPGRERRPKWRLLQGSKLSVWMQNDRIFFFSRRMRASEVIFRTLAKERHRSGADNPPKSKADPARSNRRSLECERSEKEADPWRYAAISIERVACNCGDLFNDRGISKKPEKHA